MRHVLVGVKTAFTWTDACAQGTHFAAGGKFSAAQHTNTFALCACLGMEGPPLQSHVIHFEHYDILQLYLKGFQNYTTASIKNQEPQLYPKSLSLAHE